MAGKEGWNWLEGTPKWHYFDTEGRSLCGKWLIWSKNSDAQIGNDDRAENCKACRTKLKKRDAAKQQPTTP